MRSTGARAALGAALLVIAVVLFVVLQNGDDDGTTGGADPAPVERDAGQEEPGAETAPPPARPSVPTVEVRGGEPVGGVARLEFSAGERARFTVEADAPEEVHLHGYDLEEDVAPGAPARFDFPATIEGVFEIELHGSGVQIAELRVSP